MSIAASAVLQRVRDLIQDSGSTRWTDAELLRWLSDGQREIVMHKPEAGATTATKAVAGGQTKQSLTSIDSTAFQFLDVLRNMGANGTPGSANDGRAIRAISREVLDAQIPTWHYDTNADGYVKHFVFDARDPLTFFLYPKPPATWQVEIVYAKVPADISSVGTNIGIPDIYSNALGDYIVYRAYSKDVEYAGSEGLAARYYTSFANALGIKHSAEAARLPAPGSKLEGNPNVA